MTTQANTQVAIPRAKTLTIYPASAAHVAAALVDAMFASYADPGSFVDVVQNGRVIGSYRTIGETIEVRSERIGLASMTLTVGRGTDK